MTTSQKTWISATGEAVPAKWVPKIDKARTRLVKGLCKEAEKVSAALMKLRQMALAACDAFIDRSAEDNAVALGGQKGNVNLTSFDGLTHIKIRKPEYIHFDERLLQAKALIDEFLAAHSNGGTDEALVQLITAAFTTTRDGRLRADAICSLQRRVRISDPTWRRAMELIEESKQGIAAKTYIRFYTRPSTKADFTMIPLNIADAVEEGGKA